MTGMRVLPFLALAAGLTACGGSSHHTTTAQPAAPTQSAASSNPSASTTTPTAATTPSSPQTPAAHRIHCRASNLRLSYLGQNGATGKAIIGFKLRNTAGSTCHTFGFPGILFVDRAGGGLPTISQRTTHDFAGQIPLRSLDLAPGATVSFRLGVTHGIASSVGCTTADGVQVIPPDDTATLRIRIPGGAYYCRTVTISPLAPGTSAFQ